MERTDERGAQALAMDLGGRKCAPAKSGTPPLTADQITLLLPKVPGWEVHEVDGIKRIRRSYELRDFVQAMGFVNQVAELAEGQQHHPDIHIYYNRVVIELWTHTVRGLHDNDFIMAHKVDHMAGL